MCSPDSAWGPSCTPQKHTAQWRPQQEAAGWSHQPRSGSLWQLLWAVSPPNSVGSHPACQQYGNASSCNLERHLVVLPMLPQRHRPEGNSACPLQLGSFICTHSKLPDHGLLGSSSGLARVSPRRTAAGASFELKLVTFRNGSQQGLPLL